MKGGVRTGAGSKKGSRKTITKRTREAAKLQAEEDGLLLPHQILLRAANGLCFKQRQLVITYYKDGEKAGKEKSRHWEMFDYYPSVPEQIDAAKAAAPYYAPRLASTTVGTDEKTKTALVAVMNELSKQLPD